MPNAVVVVGKNQDGVVAREAETSRGHGKRLCGGDGVLR